MPCRKEKEDGKDDNGLVVSPSGAPRKPFSCFLSMNVVTAGEGTKVKISKNRIEMDRNVRLAMLSPVAWRTPPKSYGPWECVVSLITEGLVRKGVTLRVRFFPVSRERLPALSFASLYVITCGADCFLSSFFFIYRTEYAKSL